MANSVIKYIYEGTKLDGEGLADWTKMWKELTPEQQEDLRQCAEREMAAL